MFVIQYEIGLFFIFLIIDCIVNEMFQHWGSFMKRQTNKELKEEIERLKKENARLKENTKGDAAPSELFYHTLFDASPTGILLEDATGVILKVNPAFCSLLGYAEDELIGRKVHFLVSPDKQHEVDLNIKKNNFRRNFTICGAKYKKRRQYLLYSA